MEGHISMEEQGGSTHFQLVDESESVAARDALIDTLQQLFPTSSTNPSSSSPSTASPPTSHAVVAGFVAVLHKQGLEGRTEKSYRTLSVGCGSRSVGHRKVYQQALGDDLFTAESGADGVAATVPSSILQRVHDFTLFDAHAEVLARKGLQSLLLSEALMWKGIVLSNRHKQDDENCAPDAQSCIDRAQSTVFNKTNKPEFTPLLVPVEEKEGANGVLKLRFEYNTESVKVGCGVDRWLIKSVLLCVSEPPCGDCAIVEGVSGTGAHILKPVQEGEPAPRSMAELFLREESRLTPHSADASARCCLRRTKPGKGFPTLSMSCSDKIFRWSCEGVAGHKINQTLFHASRVTLPLGVVLFSTQCQPTDNNGSNINGNSSEQALFRGVNQFCWWLGGLAQQGDSAKQTVSNLQTPVRDLRPNSKTISDGQAPSTINLPAADVGLAWGASPSAVIVESSRHFVANSISAVPNTNTRQSLGNKRSRDEFADNTAKSRDEVCVAQTLHNLLDRLDQLHATRRKNNLSTLGLTKLNTKLGIPLGVSERLWKAALTNHPPTSAQPPNSALSTKQHLLLAHFVSRALLKEILLSISGEREDCQLDGWDECGYWVAKGKWANPRQDGMPHFFRI